MSEKRLNELEAKVNSLKKEKIVAETTLKSLREQKDKIVAELTTLGIAPKNLGEAISKLETEINAKLIDIDSQIPEDITDA